MIDRAVRFLLAALLALPLAADEARRYLVAPRNPAVSASKLRATTNAFRAAQYRVNSFDHVGAFAVDLTSEEARELARSGELIVEPVMPRYAESDAPTQPFATSVVEQPQPAQEIPWGIAAVRAPQVWTASTGKDVNVVVVDTGLEQTHPELAGAFAGSYNALDPGKPAVDAHRHGTHVAGTIAAANNTFGVVGVAPGVKLWAVKALGDDGEGTTESVIDSFNWTIAKAKALGGRWVMNLSLGSTFYSDIEARAVSEAAGEGIVVVAAAGNLGMELVKYPAAHRGAIAVGAINSKMERATFSGYGRGLAVVAPGADIRSTIIHGFDYKVGVRAADGTNYDAWRLIGSPFISVTARVVDCGVGDPEQFPETVRGNIAWIRRGKYLFREMARNAKEAGAAAFIVQTYSTDIAGYPNWTFYPDPPEPEWETYSFPLAVGMRFDKAAELLNKPEGVTVTYSTNPYGIMNGTSMASPHVAGAVALLLELDPELSIAEIQYVLRVTATDLEDTGWSQQTGWGAIDALKAAQWVAPEKFGVPPPTHPIPSRRRSVR